jgi:uncharacterized PurR-regulated membrane protein YhhQ (DUF165 family)
MGQRNSKIFKIWKQILMKIQIWTARENIGTTFGSLILEKDDLRRKKMILK